MICPNCDGDSQRVDLDGEVFSCDKCDGSGELNGPKITEEIYHKCMCGHVDIIDITQQERKQLVVMKQMYENFLNTINKRIEEVDKNV